MKLTDFRTLGRSGLVVSPLALGTMTFGAKRWGSGEEGSRIVFDAFVDAGGNMVDTADVYGGGSSEEMLGEFIAQRKLRDRIVLATKAGFPRENGYPHAGGNGAKNINTAVNTSLRRLQTDYIDLFWLHVWDKVTPSEEVLQTLSSLMQAGKIRYFGLSNVPAWYAAKIATLAAAHGMPGPIALQFEYSLVERNIEREHLPAAHEFGLGIVPWSPLAGGFLAGKYSRDEMEIGKQDQISPELPDSSSDSKNAQPSSEGRLRGNNPFGNSKFSERNWQILDSLRTVAEEVERPLSQVALAWLLARPGVDSLLVGASRVEQLSDNLAALEIDLTAKHLQILDEVSASDLGYPYLIFSPEVNKMVFGGTTVKGR